MSFSLTLGVKWPRPGPNEHEWSEIGSAVCSKQNSVVIGANKEPYDTLLRHTGRQSFLAMKVYKNRPQFLRCSNGATVLHCSRAMFPQDMWWSNRIYG